jgi:hypothetical protein
MLASAWYDNKVVAHLSTIIGPTVKNIVRAGGAMVVKPLVVAGYTWFMGGVDLADQKRSYFECKIGTAKWPTHLFLWLIDAAMVNSHIWYAEMYPDQPKMSGRAWRKRVVFGLLRLDTSRVNSTTKVLLATRAPLPVGVPVMGGGASSREQLPKLKNRYGDHTPQRREAQGALRCEWCKLQSNAAVASGRNARRIRETRLVCSICVCHKRRGCTDIALCTDLCQSSTAAGATCFYLYHQYIMGEAVAPSPDQLGAAMDEAA